MDYNLYLSGMPYAGKTSLGPLLAQRLKMEFRDFRDLFLEEYGCTENDFLKNCGILVFRDSERKILKKHFENTIIALSGSCLYHEEQMRQLSGKIIYLDVSFEVLRKRRNSDHNKDSRPIVYNKGINTFFDLYSERRPLYEQYADISVQIIEPEHIKTTLNRVLSSLQL